MINVAGGVVWNHKHGIAVVNQKHNSWSLPKGHVDEGEDILAAAKREIHEETGIPVNALTLIDKIAEYERSRIKRDPNDPDEIRHMTLFLFTTDHEKLTPIDPENPEAQWVPAINVPELLTHPIDKIEFKRIIESPLFEQLRKGINTPKK
jgi:8-oxo-dGTP pyrophosphatase MutT (NUDIX family)